ncbi:MAG TPA: DUF86 domain-containing protein [Phycisphaerales bacterium]|nr:DUF86 domain-containing protein [Phycisphaerales bacterium]
MDFRNILVHGYNLIEDTTVWSVIETDVPRLRDEAAGLLDEIDRA